MIISKINAIHSLLPDAKFRTFGDELTWDSPDITQPTEEEIDAEIKRLQTEYDAKQYQRDRQYPSIGDQLDALYHDMTSGKGDKTGEWYKAIKKVKDDNPKPS